MSENGSIIVQKYGGSSVADADKIIRVAARIAETKARGHQVVVVVSAMGDTTDDLLALAKKVSADPHRRELDMLLTAGERISMALLGLALHARGVDAVSFTGSQSGIITDGAHSNARILEVRPVRILEELGKGRVVIVAGYQGVSRAKEITTLGRGGSDTTAVALAAALEAEVCEICSDVDGVYTADPRIVPNTRRLSELTHEEMQELAQAGAKVLNAQAVEFARDRGITIHARSTFQTGPGTQVAKTARRELRISGVAIETDLLVVRASGGKMFGELMQLLHANAAWPREVWSDNAATFALVPLENVHGPEALLAALREFTGPSIDVRRGLAQVSIVGSGLGASMEPLARAQEALKDFKVFATLTGPLRLSFLLPKESGKDAVRKLHDAFVEPAQA